MRRTYLLTVCLLATAASGLGQTQGQPNFEPVGWQSDRAYFSQFPFEQIDMANGNLLLTFTDLTLPGNAGMNLTFVRSYNQGFLQRGWTFGIAGVPLRVANPDGPPPNDCCDWPQLIGVGTSRNTTPVNSTFNDTEFMSADFSLYTTTTRTLRLPNGWVATYESGDFLPGGAMLLEVHDPYGNSITPEWESGSVRPFRFLGVTQTVGANSRTVTFTYDTASNMMPKTMTFGVRTWTYEYDHFVPERDAWFLTGVQPPAGAAWRYAYENGNGYDGWMRVTTPNGGTVLYDFADEIVPYYSSSHASVVRLVTTGGSDVTAGTWTFSYDQESAQPATKGMVDYPDGRSLEFVQDPVIGANHIGSHWTLRQKILRDSSTEVARIDRTYEDVPVTSMHAIPAPKSQTIHQSGRTYTTEHFYDHGSFSGDRHRPWKTVETGDATRVTTRVFDYDLNIWALRTKSETITVGSEAATISREHDNATGFMTQETRYGIRTRFGPDASGNVASATDEHDHTTTFTYEWGTLKDTTSPLKFGTTRTINSDGTVGSETTRNNTTSYSYDELGRPESTTPPAGHPLITEYEANGRWVKHLRGGVDGSSTTLYLDGFGRVMETENRVGVFTKHRHDVFGRKTYESLPFQSADVGTTFVYDALDRLATARTTDDNATTYSYGAGVDVTITDSEDHVTIQDWAAFGNPTDARLMGILDPGNSPWGFEYSALGKLTRVHQPGAPSRQWRYSGELLSREIHPESGETTYGYDSAGRLESKTTAEGTIEFGYDANDRLTLIDAPGTTDDVALDYDNSDNRTLIENSFVKSTFFYDSANRLEWRRDVVAGQPLRQTTYHHDAHDRVERIVYPSGRSVRYEFDAENRVTKAVREQEDARVAEVLAYHPMGAIKRLRLGNGIEETFDFDPHRYWLRGITGGPLSVTYGYDSVGNVSSVDDARPGFDQVFSYDAVDRLRIVQGFGANEYQYDAAGNRTFKANPSVTYAYDPSTRRLESATGPTPNPEIGQYSYDGVGNTKIDPAGTYTYTPFNMLDSATVGGVTSVYRYDGDNQRMVRELGSTKEISYRDSGGKVLSDFREDVPGSPVWVRDYIYLGSRLVASVSPPRPEVARFTASTSTTAENGSVTVQIEIATPTGAPVPVSGVMRYQTQDGAAVAGEDYQTTSGNITVPAGTPAGTTYTVSIPIIGDTRFEDAEAFSIRLSSDTFSFGTPSIHTVTITDDDVPPGLIIGDALTAERAVGTGVAHVWVTLSELSGKPTSFWYGMANGTANHAEDFTAQAAPVTIPAGVISHQIDVQILGDTVREPDEQFAVILSDPVNATITRSTAGVTIRDDDWPPVPSKSDFNGDGKPDLLLRHDDGTMSIWMMDGHTRLAEVTPTPAQIWDAYEIVGTSDIDADGDPDIFWRNTLTGDLSVMTMNGVTQVGGQDLVPNNANDLNWRVKAVADINMDGKPDLVWQHQTDGWIAVWTMNGTTRIEAHLLSPWALPAGWQIVATGDLNRDGFTDLVLQNDLTGDISWFRLDGYGQVSGESLTPANIPNLDWKIRGASDIDRDGFVDLLWQNTATGEVAVWLMTGTAVRESWPLVPGTVPSLSWRSSAPK